jgi:thiol-disulfide isomerase/thioredoxin
MKLKFRFPGRLWPFRKQHHNYSEAPPPFWGSPDFKYIIGLLILWLFVMLFGALRCKAQGRPLKVGDHVPDIPFTSILNYGPKVLRLSDFKDKIVVLDFWATWCSSCLAMMPEERRLQQLMPDSLQIILVNPKSTKDTHDKIAKFFVSRNHQYDFPSIDEDTILSKLFPAQAVPHYAWIRNNIVVAIPEPEDLNAANIRAVMRNERTTMASGNKTRASYTSGMVQNFGSNDSTALYCTYLGSYRQNLYPSSDMKINADGTVSRIDAVNLPLNDLLQFCSPLNDITEARILKQVADPNAFTSNNTSLAWRKKHWFVYEATFSPRSPAAARDVMRVDLERFFRLHIDTFSKDTICYVVSMGDTSKVAHGKKGVHGDNNIFDHLNGPVIFRNESMTAVVTVLEQQTGALFVNESRVRGKINLDLPADLKNVSQLSTSFSNQGFRLTPMKRRITFLLVRDENNVSQSINPKSKSL